MTQIINKPIILLGDHHGAWGTLWDLIVYKNIENCNLISVGDLGIGFKYKPEYEYKSCENLSNKFKQRNINFYGIRGNHDNPLFFTGKNRICYDNFELIEDYTVCAYENKQIQFIGGAISIDRTGRQIDVSYWENEGVIYEQAKCKKVDILITHTAPTYCFPQKFNEIVYGWAREDAYLIEDLTDERIVMDEIFKICQPSEHIYGHFHNSQIETYNGCVHRLLDINEMWELKIKN